MATPTLLTCDQYADSIYTNCVNAAAKKRDDRIRIAHEKMFGKYAPPPPSNNSTVLVPGVMQKAIEARLACQDKPLCVQDRNGFYYAPGAGGQMCQQDACADDSSTWPNCIYKSKGCGGQSHPLQVAACTECGDLYHNIVETGRKQYEKEVEDANTEYCRATGAICGTGNPNKVCTCCDMRKKAYDACIQNGGTPPLPPVIAPPPPIRRSPSDILNPGRTPSERDGLWFTPM
jgi:hypothetical protein